MSGTDEFLNVLRSVAIRDRRFESESSESAIDRRQERCDSVAAKTAASGRGGRQDHRRAIS
jgi:hypothetical protein